ncbi:copper homeostasis protein CutC [Salegentibacter maritimus]|uniref:PF03932 family protein CutC n=1 Tax=Salegentibacter maritimus TaxID=2794347 RepID=A0ABS0TDT1_9FLAO|nr:copper homeostasis protein CutC [Salegentibacter maritimus]MBI6119180.1 copper homeostasis protein CutC [Salegentibacter maritimus]
MSYLKEACVESLEQAIIAEKNGANRIELCANLELDGLTPSRELIGLVKSQLQIPVHVMIRPRGGDFNYNSAEIEQMASDITFCKEIGVEGVVLGMLANDKTIAVESVEKLAIIAKPMKCIFHKAIDETRNILESVKCLRETGLISGILTSGGESTAIKGLSQLKNILLEAGDMQVICAGKITDGNIEELHQKIGAKAYHGKRIVPGLEK